MARDPGLEEMMYEQLAGIEGLSEKPLFGGSAWLLDGHLLCATRDDGALVRLGKGNDAAALARPGVEPMVMGTRVMRGWIRVDAEAIAETNFARSLIEGAVSFVRSPPAKA